eukprot:Nk52_evm8s1636 gene=Nk52_evmTU8s1636
MNRFGKHFLVLPLSIAAVILLAMSNSPFHQVLAHPLHTQTNTGSDGEAQTSGQQGCINVHLRDLYSGLPSVPGGEFHAIFRFSYDWDDCYVNNPDRVIKGNSTKCMIYHLADQASEQKMHGEIDIPLDCTGPQNPIFQIIHISSSGNFEDVQQMHTGHNEAHCMQYEGENTDGMELIRQPGKTLDVTVNGRHVNQGLDKQFNFDCFYQ